MNSILSRNNITLLAIVLLHILFKLCWGELFLVGDEVYSVFHAQKSFADLYSEIRMDMNPPFYYLILHVWIKIFGIEPMFVKALPILFSLGSAVLIFNISMRLSGLLMALTNSALFLFSNIHYDFSHYIRAYSLITFLCLLSFLLLLKFIPDPAKNRRAIFLFCFTHLILIYTHYNTIFIAFFQTLFLIYFFRKDLLKLKSLLIGYVGIVLLYIPQFFVLFNIMPDENYWLEKPNFIDLKYIAHELFGNPSWVMLLSILSILFVVLSLPIFRKKVYTPDFNVKWLIYFLMWYIVPLITAYAIAQFTPMLRLRYVLYGSFGVFFLLSYCISMLRLHTAFRSIVALGLVFVFAVGFKPENRDVENWKNVADIVDLEKDQNTMVFINAHYMHLHFLYYFDREGFNDYKNVIDFLNGKDVYPLFGKDHYNLLKLDEQYDELLLILSHNQLKDPDNLLLMEIIKNGWVLCERYGTTSEAKIYRFRKDPKDCQEDTFTLSSTEETMESCYGWTINHFTSTSSQKAVYNFNHKVDSSCFEGTDKVEVLVLDANMPFSPRPVIDSGFVSKVNVRFNIQRPESESMMFVISVEEKDPFFSINAQSSILRYEYEMKDLLKTAVRNDDNSLDILLSGMVNKQLDPDNELRVYLWNFGGTPLVMRDFKIEVYLKK